MEKLYSLETEGETASSFETAYSGEGGALVSSALTEQAVHQPSKTLQTE